MAYTYEDVLESIKRRGMLHETEQSLEDSDFLDLYNEEVASYVVPLLKSLREEFFITPETITVSADTNDYRIPRRAVDIRDITYSDGSAEWSLSRLEPEEAVERYGANASSGAPQAFYLQGNYIVLCPTPSEGGTLKIPYLLNPSKLVSAFTYSGTITAKGSNTLTVASTTGLTVGGYLDVLDATDYDPIAANLKISAINSGTGVITFTSSIPSRVAVGQLLVTEDETTVPHLPRHIRALAEQRVVVKALEALGDSDGLKNAQAALKELVDSAGIALNPRVPGAARKIRGGLAKARSVPWLD